LASGERVLVNRIGWARTYLNKAGLIASKRRGWWIITDDGKQLLQQNHERIDRKTLMTFDSFTTWTREKCQPGREQAVEVVAESSSTPDEIIDQAFSQHIAQVKGELLDAVKGASSYFFEDLVMRLLRAMGYGGATGRGVVTPRSGDGGIDGVIHEDKLGLDTVVIQAKKWEGPVGRPTIQAFVGSMDFHRSRKGVVMTTSLFTRDAKDYVDRIEGKKVVLIDGDELATLMVEYRIGVTPTKTYELVDVSQDFFDEEV
jgi:restriction system protein